MAYDNINAQNMIEVIFKMFLSFSMLTLVSEAMNSKYPQSIQTLHFYQPSNTFHQAQS